MLIILGLLAAVVLFIGTGLLIAWATNSEHISNRTYALVVDRVAPALGGVAVLVALVTIIVGLTVQLPF